MNQVSWTLHRLDGSLGPHAQAWDELRMRLFGPNPMLSSTFINGLLAHFGKGQEWLGVLGEGAAVEGMCILQPAGLSIWRSFLPSQAQIGPTLLKDVAQIPALIRHLPGFVLELDLLCCDPDFAPPAEQGLDTSHTLDHALTMSVELRGTFADYWATRPRKLTQNLERCERRAFEQGLAPRLVAIDEVHPLSEAVVRYAELEALGWKGARGTALGVDPTSKQGNFYRKTLWDFATREGAIVWELWFGNKLVASRLAIRERNRIIMLKTCYSEEFAKYAPGKVLLRRTLAYCFDMWPEGRIEFYTDASEEQLKWATGRRWMRHISHYRTRVLKPAATMLRAGRQAVRARSGQASTDPTQVRVYRHPREFPANVQRLFQLAEAQEVQAGVDWYGNLIDAVYHDHPGVKFYVLEREGCPVVALPLLVTRGRLGWRANSLGNYYTALYMPALSDTGRDRDLAELLRAVMRDHRSLISVQLAPLSIEDRSFRSLQAGLRGAGLAAKRYFCFGNWFLPVCTDWTEYLRGRRGNLRSTVSRMGKKFTIDEGRVEIVSDADLENGIAAYEKVYAASWKQPEPYSAFIPGLIALCARRGWLRLGLAWLGERPIAAQIWIVANGKAQIYKLAYDEAYRAYSPGTLLTALLMEQALNIDQVQEVDYLFGDDPYKQSWMSERRERWGLMAYNPRSLMGLLGIARELAAHIVRRWIPVRKRVGAPADDEK